MAANIGTKRPYSETNTSPLQSKRYRPSFESPLPFIQLRGRRITRPLEHWEISARLNSLYNEVLKPQMQAEGSTSVKISRRQYQFLDASYFVTDDGDFMRQFHELQFQWQNGKISPADHDKKLVGLGYFKNVYELGECKIPMVRAVYRNAFSRPRIADNRMAAFAKKHRSNPHLAIDHYLVYHSYKSRTSKRCFLIKKMDWALCEFRDQITLETAVSMTLQFMKGILSLAKDGMIIEDLHWGNVLVKHNPEFQGGKQVAISDFDLLVEGDAAEMKNEPYNFFDALNIENSNPDLLKFLRSKLQSSELSLEEKIACFSKNLMDFSMT